MPIKPENKKRYPNNWHEIRAMILKRARNRCEFCGVKNYSIGARDKNDKWHNENDIHSMNSSFGEMLFGEFPKMTKVILTIAHLNHIPEDCRPENLRALCQRCHNIYDRPHRLENAKRTRDKKHGIIRFNFREE